MNEVGPDPTYRSVLLSFTKEQVARQPNQNQENDDTNQGEPSLEHTQLPRSTPTHGQPVEGSLKSSQDDSDCEISSDTATSRPLVGEEQPRSEYR